MSASNDMAGGEQVYDQYDPAFIGALHIGWEF